jgi:hypothetical protein
LIEERRRSVESDDFPHWDDYGHSLDVIPVYLKAHAHGSNLFYDLQFFDHNPSPKRQTDKAAQLAMNTFIGSLVDSMVTNHGSAD